MVPHTHQQHSDLFKFDNPILSSHNIKEATKLMITPKPLKLSLSGWTANEFPFKLIQKEIPKQPPQTERTEQLKKAADSI